MNIKKCIFKSSDVRLKTRNPSPFKADDSPVKPTRTYDKGFVPHELATLRSNSALGKTIPHMNLGLNPCPIFQLHPKHLCFARQYLPAIL